MKVNFCKAEMESCVRPGRSVGWFQFRRWVEFSRRRPTVLQIWCVSVDLFEALLNTLLVFQRFYVKPKHSVIWDALTTESCLKIPASKVQSPSTIQWTRCSLNFDCLPFNVAVFRDCHWSSSQTRRHGDFMRWHIPRWRTVKYIKKNLLYLEVMPVTCRSPPTSPPPPPSMCASCNPVNFELCSLFPDNDFFLRVVQWY